MSARAHGTRARYVVDRCRCDACRQANGDYQRWRARQQAYGRTPYVDAEPVRAHLRALSAAGLGWRRAAEQAGLATSVVSGLLYRDRARCRRRTARALLAVRAHPDRLGAAALVPAVGTQRRLQALVAIGWPQARLADRMGMLPGNFGRVISGPDLVRVSTARRAAALYDELWSAPPAETTAVQRQAATRARNHARRHGWAPPLAWDDDAIDDPTARPTVDVADPRPGRVLLDLGEVEHLAEAGAHLTEIALRLGVTVHTIHRARRRAAAREAS